MAHFAQLDENNVVTQVIVVGNDQLKGTVTTEVDGFLVSQTVESEAKGIEFLQGLFGADTVWKQTSYNANFRGKYAGIGDTFENGVFFNPDAPVVEAPVIATQEVQVLATAQIQALTTTDIQALGTAQVQALTTEQISALGA